MSSTGRTRMPGHPGESHRCCTFDITMHDKGATCPDGDWAQATYLVHGWDDVLWTDDLDQALEYLRESCERALAERKP